MKTFLLFLVAVALLASCGNKSTAPEAEVGEAVESAGSRVAQATTYNVNSAESQIMWTGSKLVGDNHTGTFDVQEGRLAMSEGKLVGGEFTIDINSIQVTDLESGKGKEKLEGHLSSGDFFDAEKFPTAKFVLTQAQPVEGNPEITHNLTGNLTLRGETKSITIPANVMVTETALTAVTPAFSINRTDWNMKYGSGLLGVAQDKAISDEVQLVINLKASRA